VKRKCNRKKRGRAPPNSPVKRCTGSGEDKKQRARRDGVKAEDGKKVATHGQ